MRRLTILFKPIILLCIIYILNSCGKDAYDYGVDSSELDKSEGLVELNLSADYKVSVKSNGENPAINIDDFCVQVFNSNNVKIKNWNKLSEMTNASFKLNVGNFKLLAFYGDSLKTDFESPYYKGITYFSVLGQKTVTVNTVCKLSNVETVSPPSPVQFV